MATFEESNRREKSPPLQRRSFLKLAGLAATSSTLPSGLQAQQTDGPSLPAILARKARNLYVNQAGYLADQDKVATIILESEPPTEPAPDPATKQHPVAPNQDVPRTFQVSSVDTGKAVFSGPLSTPFFDPLAGDHVCFADFSALHQPGRYQVSALGKTGDIFLVAATVYAEPLRLAMRAFYGQRCGCKVDLGNGYEHPTCHHKSGFGLSSGHTGSLNNSGGWHDAGDYGRYIVNSGITCGSLLLAWELFPDALRTLHLDLPESGRAIPDFLAEVKWNLDWMLTLQDSADGGVWHKQTSSHFCGFVMPEEDQLLSEVIGTGSEPYKNTCASADFAAVMAMAARCYKPFDEGFAARCLLAARHAFAWCQAHPEVPFKNPAGVTTGEYGDPHCDDEILWAAAELFRTTQEPVFEQVFLAGIAPGLATLRVQTPSWNNVAALALWSYVFAHGSGANGNSTCEAILQATQEAAGQLIQQSRRSAYGTTLDRKDFGWGSNSTAANQSLLLLVADRFRPAPETFAAALSNLHYLLGRNCFGVSWMTHVGLRPFLHPHHRPSAADKIAAPWPGLLSGGPNQGGGDPVADHLPASAPMRMWLDDERAYSLNEIAINWNAPLVFLLAAANSRQTRASAVLTGGPAA